MSSVKGSHGFALDLQVKQFLPKASKQTKRGEITQLVLESSGVQHSAFGTALHGCTKSGSSMDLRQAKSEGGG